MDKRIKYVVRSICAVKILGDLHFPRAWYPNALHFLEHLIHMLNFPRPFSFPHPRFKTQYFPQLEKHKFPAREKGGVMSTMVFRPTTQWDHDSFGLLVHEKWPKPTYHIKTKENHPDVRILKKARMSPHGLAPGRSA